MEIKDRIKLIIDKEGITPRVFAETIGMQQSTLSHVLNGRNNPSLEVIMKIHQTYNDINLEWLLYGNGEMTEIATYPNTSPNTPQPSLFDVHTTASDSSDENEPKEKEIIKSEIRYIEKPQRKITEIRIFFDDNTYETFRGEN
ncbi:MAG: helix-turn-helix domain-containing protein [Bacteroides sp.]